MGGHRQSKPHNRARSQLRRRLEREALGDEHYKNLIKHNDEKGFILFGLGFVALLAVLFFGAT